MAEWTPQDLADLRLAHDLLENPGLAAKLTALLGSPIEKGLKMLPDSAGRVITGATHKALLAATQLAVASMSTKDGAARVARPFLHKLSAAATGAAGGFFGLAALPVELPVSTTIMLRSIADIARSEGEDLDTPESRLACLEVFALGGRTEEDDAADTGYYGLRLALSLPVSTAAYHVARKGLVVGDGAPFLVELIHGVASRFGIALSEKAAFYTLPVIGAATGATINMIFLHHFQEMARSHFAVRRLERKYGADVVRAAYETLT